MPWSLRSILFKGRTSLTHCPDRPRSSKLNPVPTRAATWRPLTMPNPNPNQSGLTNFTRLDTNNIPLDPKGIYLRLYADDGKILATMTGGQRTAWIRRIIREAIDREGLRHGS